MLGKHSYISGELQNIGRVKLEVGNYTSISTGLTVIGGQAQHPPVMHPECVSTYPFNDLLGLPYHRNSGADTITIGSDVWIGANVTILGGVTVGHGAIIGTASCVAANVLPYTIVVGNPGKVVRERFSRDTIQKLLAISWWNWDEERISDAVPYMKDIRTFLEWVDKGELINV